MMKALFILLLTISGLSARSLSAPKKNAFVTIQNGQFMRWGKPYYFVGANFWQGMNLGDRRVSGNRELLMRELDRMKAHGITQLRVLALSEGPTNEPYRVIPPVQPFPGVFDEEVLQGLDFLLDEMKKREMTAVLMLSNFWPWSGGFSQWVSWEEESSIPYPPPHPGGSWGKFQEYSSRFYTLKGAVRKQQEAVRRILTRVNSLSGIPYNQDPTIMAWQLANEPRGGRYRREFLDWIKSSAQLIRSLAPHQLISLGSEGNTLSASYAGNHFIQDHSIKEIDYATIHIWVENWGIYNPRTPAVSLPLTINMLKKYLKDHVQEAQAFKKPIVLEELGLARDARSMNPASPTLQRDEYFESALKEVMFYLQNGQKIQGINFWAWSGESRPLPPFGSLWREGDPLLGDPAHEEQGWYGIYDTDTSTLNLLKSYAQRMKKL